MNWEHCIRVLLTCSIWGFSLGAVGCSETGPLEDIAKTSEHLCANVTATPDVVGPQTPGTTITFSALSTCGNGETAEYKFFYGTPGGSEWTLVRDWGSSVYSWNTTGFESGKHRILVYSRVQGTSVSYDSYSVINPLLTDVCDSVSLSASPESPQISGTNVTINGSATCTLGATAEYQFAFKSASAPSWTFVQSYSTNNTYNWNTTGLSDGKYTFLVYARRQGNSSPFESYQTIDYIIGAKACSSVSLATFPASPQNAGTVVSVSGNASCGGGGTPEYQYFVKRSDVATWTELRSYGAGSTSWDTTGLTNGSYQLLVYARAVGSSQAYESYAWTSFTVGDSCSSLALSTNPNSVVSLGNSVSVTPIAQCGAGQTPEYQFYWRNTTETTWHQAQAYTTIVPWTWIPSTPGTYVLLGYTRAQGSSASYEAYSTSTITVQGNNCTSVTLSASPSSPQPVNTVINFTAAGECGTATPEYRFFYRLASSSTWIPDGTWTADPNYVWTTPSSPIAGDYQVLVYVRAQGSSVAYQAYKLAPFEVGTQEQCTGVVISTSPTSPQTSGTSVTLTGISATCAPSGTPEYAFFYKPSTSGTWVPLRAYDVTPSMIWDTTGLPLGAYDVLVYTRAAGNGRTYDSYSFKSYTLGDMCQNANINVSPTSPQIVGTPITLNATSTCTGSATAEYKYWVKKSTDVSWNLIQDFSQSSAIWNTVGLPSGDYQLLVYARAVGMTSTFDSYKWVSFKLNP